MQRSLQQHVKRARLAQCLRFLAVCFLWLAAVSVSRNARADALVNGGFDSGLSGWQTQGGVFPSMGVAVLADDSFTSGLLWQPVASLDGRFTLTFDYNNALSASVPQGALADSFFATLYFTDNLATFDIAGGMFDQAISLFDLDATGLANVTGSIGPSSKGANWSLFTLTFDNTHGFIVPAFDLRDLNLVNDDSAVALDNVKLTEIPEITQSPQDTVVRAGNDAMFTAAASSSRPLTFQWRRDGVDIPGATLPSLTLESLMPSDGGLITVVASDGANNVESAPARLAVLRLERVARQDEDAVIDFQSVAGVSYAIEFTTNLVSNVWTPLFNGLGGTGNVLSVVSPEQGTRATLFYRLRIGNVVSAPAGLLRVKVRKRGKFPLALPFEEKAEEYGRITSSGAAMLMDTLAVWTPGQWSLAPHTARIITGAAVGRHFPITANTATQLTLEAAGEDLSAIL
ncbi:MAG TPA: immunoglobulin domain-containing protein, partial [Chthoniobacteraceae bacterium]|nr:immunoglobulin domain-containing protein [Chthoniobacteraceae bacterium]